MSDSSRDPAQGDLPVEVRELTGLRQASARVRYGHIVIQMPRHWSRAYKDEMVTRLVGSVRRKEARQRKLAEQARRSGEPRVTITSQQALQEWVDAVNAETFRIPGVTVRLGRSRYSTLAYIDVPKRLITFSRFSLQDVTHAALRYLTIHELAHCLEGRHNRRFWALVAQHAPDYAHQSKVIGALYADAVARDERLAPPKAPRPPRELAPLADWEWEQPVRSVHDFRRRLLHGNPPSTPPAALMETLRQGFREADADKFWRAMNALLRGGGNV